MRKLAALMMSLVLAAFAAGDTLRPSTAAGDTVHPVVVHPYPQCVGFTAVPGCQYAETAEPDSSLLTDLVSYWALDEASGVRADTVGSNDLTDNNTVGSTSKGVGAPANLPNTVASFVAANSEYLSGTTPTSFSSGTARTVSFWWYGGDTGSNRSLFHVGTTGGTGRLLLYNSGTEPNGVANVYAGGGGTASAGFYSSGTWIHYIYTFDGVNSHKLYANNVERVSRTVADSGDTTSLLWGVSAAGYWQGYISSGAIWSRVLTADERACLYNSGAGTVYPFIGVCN